MQLHGKGKTRRLLALTASVATVLALAACGTTTPPQESGDPGSVTSTVIRALVPHPGEPTPFEFRSFAVVDKAEFLEGTGVSVEAVSFENFGQMAVLVSDGNSAEMANQVGISSVLPAWAGGAKGFRAIAAGSISPVFQLVTAKAIADIEQLDGGVIGILGPNTAGTEAVDLLIEQAGLSGKVSQTIVGAGSAAIAALEAGSIQAVPYSPPLSTQLEEQGYNIVGEMSDVLPDYVTGVTIVNAEWAEANRDAVVAYLAAAIKVGDWLSDPANRDEVISYLESTVKSGGDNISASIAESMYEFYIADARLSFDGYAPQKAVEGNLGVGIKRGSLSEVPSDLHEMFDWSYLSEALESLDRDGVEQYTPFNPTKLN